MCFTYGSHCSYDGLHSVYHEIVNYCGFHGLVRDLDRILKIFEE